MTYHYYLARNQLILGFFAGAGLIMGVYAAILGFYDLAILCLVALMVSFLRGLKNLIDTMPL